jgi:hypothetical protein
MINKEWSPIIRKELVLFYLISTDNNDSSRLKATPVTTANCRCNEYGYSESLTSLDHRPAYSNNVVNIVPVSFPVYEVSVLIPDINGRDTEHILGYEQTDLEMYNWYDDIAAILSERIDKCEDSIRPTYLIRCRDKCEELAEQAEEMQEAEEDIHGR